MSLDISFYNNDKCVGSSNMTHNVTDMWAKAECYDALYFSEGKIAGEIKPILRHALLDMTARFNEYKRLDALNGWGKAEHAIKFLTEVYFICEDYPNSIIRIDK